jgi:hypothetical protein
MISALILVVANQATLAPMLPMGSSPELHRAFELVAMDLSEGRFDQARAKAKLLPRLTVTYEWNDANVPQATRADWAGVRNRAFKTLAERLPGLTFKASKTPTLRFSFEKSLAPDPNSGLPRGIALFYSESVQEPRLEAVIGLSRGNPLEKTGAASLHNEILFAVGSYLGLAPRPFLGTAMGRVDLQMQADATPEPIELGAMTAVQAAVAKLDQAIAKKQPLTPAKPKANFNPEVIERGPVIQGEPIRFSVQVSNQGNAPLQFLVIPDCGCISAGGSPVVQPGAAVPVPIHVDTKDINGPFNRHLILISNDPEQPIRHIPIGVTTTPRYRFLSNEHSILIVDEKGLNATYYLVSPKEKPLAVTSVEVMGNPGRATFEPWQGQLADPERNEPAALRTGYKLNVHLDEPQTSGRSAATITVKTGDPDYPILRHVVFAQRGIAVMPASVFYGDLGKAEREASVIVTRPNKPFKILSIDSDSSFVTARATAVKGEWEYKVLCRYNGKAPMGDFRAMLTLNTDDPKQAKIRIPVMGIVK